MPPAPDCYSRATIFQIDESTNVASEFDSSAPSNFAGSEIMEVTQTDTPQVVWQMNVAGSLGVGVYRGYRIPSLYPGVTWQH